MAPPLTDKAVTFIIVKDWILLSDHVQYKPTMSLCISVYMFVRFVGTDDLRSEVELCLRTLAACAA